MYKSFAAAAIAALTSAQQIGTNTQEQHLSMNIESCFQGSCTKEDA